MEQHILISVKSSKSIFRGAENCDMCPFFSRTLELVELLKNIIKSPV
ncbi:hypothetical protein A33Q_3719 [Indibacter alkaliphilus LW1]|uniref:Uncharacterized protein n=1 Tax=Indibacter alkaliphilus (strain CCUG 57479 / KCTC 22604 / LW1) TaxID=1189612 RepID=S2DV78_INDAL|nr:hypothetical protein A33Q_3719 [Indibacter alkaliphilus LW1]